MMFAILDTLETSFRLAVQEGYVLFTWPTVARGIKKVPKEARRSLREPDGSR